MVKITCQHVDRLKTENLRALYEDSGWVSYTKDMDKLLSAVRNSLCVITAWYNDELIGLLRAVGDGETILYIQDILVMQKHRRHKIATGMVEKLLKKYPQVRQKVLLTDDTDDTRGFYEEIGFMSCDQGDLVSFVRFD